MTLQTEHHLICNGCDREQKGDHLRDWFAVTWDRVDWSQGYSVQSGHAYKRTTLHACSMACLMVIAERRLPAARPDDGRGGD